MTAGSLLAGPPSGAVVVAAAVFGVVFAVQVLVVVVFAWHDRRHVAALRAADPARDAEPDTANT